MPRADNHHVTGSPEDHVQPAESLIEQPDVHALRTSAKAPPRLLLHVVRMSQALKNLKIPWTALLAIAILVILAATYLALS
jgi:hypothetical protein